MIKFWALCGLWLVCFYAAAWFHWFAAGMVEIALGVSFVFLLVGVVIVSGRYFWAAMMSQMQDDQ